MAEGEFIFDDSDSIEATFIMDVTEADHNALFNRDIPDQHPISAITDLQTTLDGISGDISAETTRAEGVEGNLENLTTDDKNNLVSAINEVDSHADTNTNNLANEVTRAKSVEGVLSNLTTTNKTNLVGAINEVDSNTDTNATNLSNHIANKSNPHEVTKAQVGLGNVDNTSDLNKPISTATQTALNGKQDNLSQEQLNAVNSGINSTLVGQISTNQTEISTINGKIPSDASSSNQLADKSYVDTADGGLQTQITANAGDIDTIEGKIPSAASSSNQLADKSFVNSSIATNTANFIGTFNSVADLEAYSGTLTNNDYAFVIVTDSLGNTAYDRYKYTTATTPASWLFEYELNNSSFTADQWAAINSGATSTNIGQIATNTSAISGLSTSKQDKIDSSHKLDSDLVDDSGQTNKFVTSAEKAQISTNASNITALQSGKANVGLDNLNADGQMIIDSVNGCISNCILEIPQRVNVSIDNNVVTVKAGSKVYIPNGTNVYNEVTIPSDLTRSYAPDNNSTYVVLYRQTGNKLEGYFINGFFSGSTEPTPFGTFAFWYDTANNVIKYTTNSGTTWTTYGDSFPIAIYKKENGVVSFAKDSNGNDMIFNGCGFIGYHAFVYPNIVGLASDGIDTDGNLKSTRFVTNSLRITEMQTSTNNFVLNADGANIFFYSKVGVSEVQNYGDINPSAWNDYYVKSENKVYGTSGATTLITRKDVVIIDCAYNGTTVTDFTIRQPYEGARNLLTESLQADVTTLTGYDSTQTQTLKNINGVLQWVTD